MQTHHNTHIHINTLSLRTTLQDPGASKTTSPKLGSSKNTNETTARLLQLSGEIDTQKPSSIYIVLYTPLIPLGLINLWRDTNKNLSSLKVVAKVLLPLRTHKLYIAPPNSKEPGEPPRRPTTTTTTTMRDRS